jgi:hypothetical protein
MVESSFSAVGRFGELRIVDRPQKEPLDAEKLADMAENDLEQISTICQSGTERSDLYFCSELFVNTAAGKSRTCRTAPGEAVCLCSKTIAENKTEKGN